MAASSRQPPLRQEIQPISLDQQLVAISRRTRHQCLHHLSQAHYYLTGDKEEMHVVCHQTICINLYTINRFELTYIIRITAEIRLAREHHRPVMTALDHLTGIIWKYISTHPWHLRSSLDQESKVTLAHHCRKINPPIFNCFFLKHQ